MWFYMRHPIGGAHPVRQQCQTGSGKPCWSTRICTSLTHWYRFEQPHVGGKDLAAVSTIVPTLSQGLNQPLCLVSRCSTSTCGDPPKEPSSVMLYETHKDCLCTCLAFGSWLSLGLYPNSVNIGCVYCMCSCRLSWKIMLNILCMRLHEKRAACLHLGLVLILLIALVSFKISISSSWIKITLCLIAWAFYALPCFAGNYTFPRSVFEICLLALDWQI